MWSSFCWYCVRNNFANNFNSCFLNVNGFLYSNRIKIRWLNYFIFHKSVLQYKSRGLAWTSWISFKYFYIYNAWILFKITFIISKTYRCIIHVWIIEVQRTNMRFEMDKKNHIFMENLFLFWKTIKTFAVKTIYGEANFRQWWAAISEVRQSNTGT